MDKKGLLLANTSDFVASAHCDLEAEWVTAIVTGNDELCTSVLPFALAGGFGGSWSRCCLVKSG